MTNSQIHPEGWITVSIDEKYETWAKTLRNKRDSQYENIYPEIVTDERWVGELGELVFKSWLKHEGINNFEWVLDDAAGKPDFLIAKRHKIGVKTVKRAVPMRADYTQQITARHAEEPVDHFFFMSYEISVRRMWLVGGIDRSRFLQEARYYCAGEWVHPGYQVRDHDIYNIEVAKLIPPKDWIVRMT